MQCSITQRICNATYFESARFYEAKLEALTNRLGAVRTTKNGINVTATHASDGSILARTHERGGAGLTYSCASASACAALVGLGGSQGQNEIEVVTKRGSFLVSLVSCDEDVYSMKIEGLVSPIYDTEVDLEYLKKLASGTQGITQMSSGMYVDAIGRHDALRRDVLEREGFFDWCIEK